MTPAIRPVVFDERLFAPVIAEGVDGDGAFLARLAEEWREGAVRFDREGEVLLGVFIGAALIGVGGISRDPYSPAPGLGRLRHVFVMTACRRQGLGRLLVEALLKHAESRFGRLRLRTASPGAARLYESFGFVPMARPEQSHEIELGSGAFIRSSSISPETGL